MSERKIPCLNGGGAMCPENCDFRRIIEQTIEMAAAMRNSNFEAAAATFNQKSTEAARIKVKQAYPEYRCQNDPLM